MPRWSVPTRMCPEHTGEDRCWPCTLANVAAVAVVAFLAGRRRRALGALVLGAGLTLVWARGYVIPGTPRFAPRLVEGLGVAHLFEAERAPESGSGTLSPEDAPEGEELLGALAEAGVLRVEGERVVPDPGFEERWHEEMDRLAALDTDALADEVLGVAHAADAYAFGNHRGEWVVVTDGSDDFEGEEWLNRPTAVAEAAAARALDGRVDDATRLAAAGAMPMFLEACPDCGAALEATTAAACCGGYTGPDEVPEDVLACPDCRARVFTF